MNYREALGVRVLTAGVLTGVLACTDLENAGPQNAGAFDTKFEVKTKQGGPSGDMISLAGQGRDSDWLSIKFDGSVWDLNPARADASTSYGFKINEPGQVERNVTDTRLTIGMWDDWVRWSSRQAVSNYIIPGNDIGDRRYGEGRSDNSAMSQRIEAGILKTGSTRLSLFADYAAVGAYFMAPTFAIKRQDPLSKPNSTTTRFGGIFQGGPISFTLEQRAQRQLAPENSTPTHVQNQIGVSLSVDEWLGRSHTNREDMSWVVPSSAWLNVGQGKMKSSLIEGITADTTFDVSAGLSWQVGKIYANLGYWQSHYKSQLYPWKGSAINGSLGFAEDKWGVDMYFDVTHSVTSYGVAGVQPTTQTFDVTSGLRFHGMIFD